MPSYAVRGLLLTWECVKSSADPGLRLMVRVTRDRRTTFLVNLVCADPGTETWGPAPGMGSHGSVPLRETGSFLSKGAVPVEPVLGRGRDKADFTVCACAMWRPNGQCQAPKTSPNTKLKREGHSGSRQGAASEGSPKLPSLQVRPHGSASEHPGKAKDNPPQPGLHSSHPQPPCPSTLLRRE